MKIQRRLLARLLLAGIAGATVSVASAQSYPTKAVRIVVPFPPTGAADLLTRALANKLSEELGQPVTADNRPGAGGNIGAEQVARAAPDGYTLLMGAVTTHAVSMSLYQNLHYDLEKDLVPVSLVANVPHILVVNPSVPAKNLGELLVYLKAENGKVNFASQGNGTLSHLEFELLKSQGGFSANHIPYKGSAPALTDLLSGRVEVLFDSIPSSLPMIQAGKLRGIAGGLVATISSAAGLADAGRVGPARLCRRQLVRLDGAGRNAEGRDRQAQCERRQSARCARGQGDHHASGRLRDGQHARGDG